MESKTLEKCWKKYASELLIPVDRGRLILFKMGIEILYLGNVPLYMRYMSETTLLTRTRTFLQGGHINNSFKWKIKLTTNGDSNKTAVQPTTTTTYLLDP